MTTRCESDGFHDGDRLIAALLCVVYAVAFWLCAIAIITFVNVATAEGGESRTAFLQPSPTGPGTAGSPGVAADVPPARSISVLDRSGAWLSASRRPSLGVAAAVGPARFALSDHFSDLNHDFARLLADVTLRMPTGYAGGASRQLLWARAAFALDVEHAGGATATEGFTLGQFGWCWRAVYDAPLHPTAAPDVILRDLVVACGFWLEGGKRTNGAYFARIVNEWVIGPVVVRIDAESVSISREWPPTLRWRSIGFTAGLRLEYDQWRVSAEYGHRWQAWTHRGREPGTGDDIGEQWSISVEWRWQ